MVAFFSVYAVAAGESFVECIYEKQDKSQEKLNSQIIKSLLR